MAPKKKDDGPKERPLLGRFKSNLKARAARCAPPARAPRSGHPAPRG